MELRQTHLGIFDVAGWQAIPDWARTRTFLFPLSPNGLFDGNNGPAGHYRVVFNNFGQYLGVVRIREGLPAIMPRQDPRDLAPMDLARFG